VEPWFDALPRLLEDLGGRWELELESPVPRGSMSAVFRCRTADGRAAVLKVAPDQARLATEARALAAWRTQHVPAVLAVDEALGALLLEAVEPGTPLAESPSQPGAEQLAALVSSLHENGSPDPSFPPVAARVAHLFDSGRKHHERRPDLAGLVPPELYERGRALALRLAEDAPATVLLHGDLTPLNVLDGGEARGLVAIDPAACLGDPAFDAVDLVLWRAEDAGTIAARVEALAAEGGADPGRLLAWCSAFAGMTALETAENGAGSPRQLRTYVELASSAA